MQYPITYAVDYVERHSRLTTFFRLILAIPLLIWQWIWGIAVLFVVIISWFALLFTARFPEGMYRFIAIFLRFSARMRGYTMLLTDRYSSFGGEPDETYPVRVGFAGPLPKYNRWKVLFRFILVIPVAIFVYLLQLLLEIVGIAAWFAILFTGRLPRGLYDLLAFATSYETRVYGYMYLLTETYPPVRQDMMVSTEGSTEVQPSGA
jgi:hypothetical protein